MNFPSIRIEGAILSADLLSRLESGDLSGQRPVDFGVETPAALKDDIVRAWTHAQAFHRAFREKLETLKPGATGTTETRNLFVIPLLALLGYGDLEFSKPETVGDKSFPISHRLPSRDWFAVHIIGARESLDKPPASGSGPRTRPHALVQEYLNLTEHLYALVTNGRLLRLLRDSTRLIKLSYVEFDLDRIFAEELFADFAVLYRLLHVSRLPKSRADAPQSLVERYHQDALDSGARIRDGLSVAVAEAMQELGSGFLARTPALQSAVADGSLAARDFHHGILRLIYRLLFLMVAEERGLLYPADADPRRRRIYHEHYSLARLRRLAERRALVEPTKPDLWRSLLSTFRLFEVEGAGAPLGLTALCGHLLAPTALGPLTTAELDNGTLLSALARLSLFRDPQTGQRTRVNYGALATEEFGSVYESLLELHPVILDGTPPRFAFKQAAGNERKTTGSYYTPSSLVECLLDSALDPVVEQRLAEAKRVVDSGQWVGMKSGHAENPILPGLARVAEGDGPRGGLLSPDTGLSEGGTVRSDLADSPRGELRSGQHGGGLGKELHEGIHPVPVESQRQPKGIGNPSHPESSRGNRAAVSASAAAAEDGRNRQDAGLPHWLTGETREQVAAALPANRYPLLASQALLSLRVCDPAVGSGHFLIAAGHRLARRLATLRSGDDEPSPDQLRHALREVISHCLYGVDVNPMSVELCKVTLWLEATEPGKPLSFLDHHIQCGNSLLGATPRVLADGLPDDAFKPIEGDDKTVCAEAKKRNKSERQQLALFHGTETAPRQHLGNLPAAMLAVGTMSDDTADALHAKEQRYAELIRSTGYLGSRFLADAWCAAFVWKKTRDLPYPITNDVLRKIERNPHDCAPWMREEIERLRDRYQFFHWHLAFPEVFPVPGISERPANEHAGWNGGFDVVLGNPPWEMVSAEEGESSDETMERLQFCYRSNEYEVLGGRRDLYKLFLISGGRLTSLRGQLGLIVPLGVFIEDDASDWRAAFFNQGSVIELRHFQNQSKSFFPQVHGSYRFCTVLFTPRNDLPHAFTTTASNPGEIQDQFHVQIERRDFDLVLGEDRSAIIFPARKYAEVHQRIRANLSALPQLKFRIVAEFHASTDKSILRKQRASETDWELLRNRNIHQFNHRFAEIEDWLPASEVASRLARKHLSADPWLDRSARLVFRDIARNDDERTLISCLVPPGCVSSYDTPMIVPEAQSQVLASTLAITVAAFNSFASDFFIRPFVDKHIKGYTLKRAPWPDFASEAVRGKLPIDLVPRILELSYTDWRFEPFARDCGWFGPPFVWDEARRFQLRCELDAAFLHLYGLSRADAAYILDTFPIVRRKDEAAHGTYRTRDTILALYDQFAECAAESRAFASAALALPPADPRAAHPPRLPEVPRTAFEGREYFETVLPLLLRMAPAGLDRARLFHAITLLTDATLRRTAARQELGDVGGQWAEAFTERYGWADAGEALLAEMQKGRIRGVDQLRLAPEAVVTASNPWLCLDAFIALRLALAAEPAAARQSESAQQPFVARIIQLAQAA